MHRSGPRALRAFAARASSLASAPDSALLVNHGYPPAYNAGSEIYTQLIARELAARHVNVAVFSREEDPFRADYSRRLSNDNGIPLHTVNYARAMTSRFSDANIDSRFDEVMGELQPEVVHFNHLNHLSLGLPAIAKQHGAAVAFTLHDFWLMCPRGQFLQAGLSSGEVWPVCDGAGDSKCAQKCMSRLSSGLESRSEQDQRYWEDVVASRREAVKAAVEQVDLFFSPSLYLRDRFVVQGGFPKQRMAYLPYGFDKARLASVERVPGEPFTFGFLGRHVPAKGLDHLIAAFRRIQGNAQLRIWGRPEAHVDASLRALAEGDARIQFQGEYANDRIVAQLDKVDALVVPSRWMENSPLVIHEAQQAHIPVITADVGGMAELVKNGINGLTFEHRSVDSLAAALQRSVDEPAELARLGKRGYLLSSDGDVPGIQEHVSTLIGQYDKLLSAKRAPKTAPASLFRRPGPVRVTFDTNPDTCNFGCTMCEGFSEHSSVQAERKAAGKARRVMDPRRIEVAVRDLVPHGLREIIPSTMGEPLLYRDFGVFLRLCAEFAPRLKLNLTTNCSFPDNRHLQMSGVESWAKALLPVLSDVKFSWNGATKETHERIMKNSDFDRTLRNLSTFLSMRDDLAASGGNRASVTLQLTFMEDNHREFPALVDLAAHLGVDRVKGHHLRTHWAAMAPQSLRRSAQSVARWNSVAADCRVAAQRGGVRLEGFGDLSFDTAASVAASAACPFLGNELWVNAEGVIFPCCAPDKERLELGYFGSVRERGDVLLTAWRSGTYRELMGNYPSKGVCQKCTMRR